MSQAKDFKEPRYLVQTVDRAIEVLKLLATECSSGEMGLTEMSKRLNLGKSTVHRILETLMLHRFAEQCSETGKYRLGWGIFEIGNRVPESRDIRRYFRPVLWRLCEEFGETSNVAIRDGKAAVIIDKADPNSRLRANPQVGEREPLHATALGKALIADMSPEEIKQLFGDNELEKLTPNTITTVPQLVEEIKNVRQRGYTVDSEELQVGLVCIGVPVRDYTGRIAAALSLSGPSHRMTFARLLEIKESLLHAAAELSGYMGWQGGKE